MAGFWLISYIILWILTVILFLLAIGFLQQLGVLQQELTSMKAKGIENTPDLTPTIEEDGPPIGTTLPNITRESINNYGTIQLAPHQRQDEGQETLLLFLAPLCESCQHVVEPINKFLEEGNFSGQVVAFLRTDESGCRSFQSLFPLHVPVVCDAKHDIMMDLNIHHSPLGLLYDTQGQLVRKGFLDDGREALQALFGDTSASLKAQAKVFPSLTSSSVLV